VSLWFCRFDLCSSDLTHTHTHTHTPRRRPFKQAQDEFHLLIIGLDGAGKTNVLEKLKTLLTDLPGAER
jgi:adenylylsulfate kinase-like enzyme